MSAKITKPNGRATTAQNDTERGRVVIALVLARAKPRSWRGGREKASVSRQDGVQHPPTVALHLPMVSRMFILFC